MPNCSFCSLLSCHGKLRLAIASTLMLQTASPAWASDIVPLLGPGGQATVFQQNGTTVAEVVAPDAQGVSHNLFNQFDVSAEGLVLNNSLHAGQSVLADSLQANPQFTDAAARLIISEVISHQPTRLDGALEVFGKPADFVALNPNGISVNGAYFINTPRVDLIVGSSERVGGQLQYTTEFAKGELTIGQGGLRNERGNVGLLAPRIDASGDLLARDDLNITLGLNRIDSASGRLLSSQQAGDVQRIDAKLFGAMRAGRITIVSTGEGAGVRLGTGPLSSRDDVVIDSAGGFEASGKESGLNLKGPDVEYARIESAQGDVHITARDTIDLTAAHIDAGTVSLKAGKNLQVTALEGRHDSGWHNIRRESNFWKTKYYTNDQLNRTARQHGSTIEARDDVHLEAGNHLAVEASSIKAGSFASLNSGQDLNLNAKEEFDEVLEKGQHRKFLWKSSWDNSRRESLSKAGSVTASQGLSLTAGRDAQLRGAEVFSGGDMQVKVAGTVGIGTAVRNEGRSGKDYVGDNLGGWVSGGTAQKRESREVHRGSKVIANGKLLMDAGDVKVTGSKVFGSQGAKVASRTGSVTIDASRGLSIKGDRNSTSHALGIFSKNATRDERGDVLTSSELRSDTNLQLVSATDLNIEGSRVDSLGKLQLGAGGNLNILEAEEMTKVSTTHAARGFDALAGEKRGRAGQWDAGYTFGQNENSVDVDKKTGFASRVTGAEIMLTTPQALTVTGSHVETTAGGLEVTARDVNLLAGQSVSTTDTQVRRRRAGYFASGGMDGASGNYHYGDSNQSSTLSENLANLSSLVGKGGLKEQVAGKHTSEGALINFAGDVSMSAAGIENRAASNKSSSRTTESLWSASVGGGVEYADLVRPIEKLINGVEQRKGYDLSVLSAMDAANVGIEVGAKYQEQSGYRNTRKALLSHIEGASVTVQAAGNITDEGTHYRANGGVVSLAAGGHDFAAAADTESTGNSVLNVDSAARVYTKTGRDTNLRLKGVGGKDTASTTTSTAVAGLVSGTDGLIVRVNEDLNYSGTQLDAGKGNVDMEAGGALLLGQAESSQATIIDKLQGHGFATFDKTRPASGGSGLGVQLIGEIAQTSHQASATQAKISSVDANGNVSLRSGAELRLEGTRIGSIERPVNGISMHAGGPLSLLASRDSRTARGGELGGGVDLGGGRVRGGESASNSLNVGGRFGVGRVKEDAVKRDGATLHSRGPVTFDSAATGDAAIHLQGATITAPSVSLQASHGDVLLESATSTEDRDNWAVKLAFGVSGERSYPAATNEPKHTSFDSAGRVKAEVDHLKRVQQQNTLIVAPQFVLQSAGNVQLLGATVQAGTVSGRVGGDLTVESRMDTERGLRVKLDVRLQGEKNAEGLIDKTTSLAGPLGSRLNTLAGKGYEKAAGKGEQGEVGKYVRNGLMGDKSGSTIYTPTLFADMSYVFANRIPLAAGIAGKNGVLLDIQGTTRLVGAAISSTEGKVQLGDSAVTAGDMNTRVFRREGGVNLSKGVLAAAEGIRNGFEQQPLADTGSAFNAGVFRAAQETASGVVKGGIEQTTD